VDPVGKRSEQIARLDQRIDALIPAEIAPTNTIDEYALMASRLRSNCRELPCLALSARRGAETTAPISSDRTGRALSDAGKSDPLFSEDRREHTVSGTLPPMPSSSGYSD
jgi:hypothetical protein